MNPSAVYCEKLGYRFEVVKTPEGEDGVCNVPGDKAIPSWSFIQGKDGAEYSYCSQRGYKYRLANDVEKCAKYFPHICLLCVLDNGAEVESSELMNIQEKGLPLPTVTTTTAKAKPTTTTQPKPLCGNSVCESTENADSCPADCKANISPIAYVALAVIVLLIAAFALMKGKMRGTGQ